jgi:hypothetical protein
MRARCSGEERTEFGEAVKEVQAVEIMVGNHGFALAGNAVSD